jgi:predicted ATP-grasp superfamily ATP-dependent carboligase
MLEAVLRDLSAIRDCRVSTTLDAAQPPLSVTNVDVHRVGGPQAERELFLQLAAADVCLIIAPELGNVLFDRCEMARAAGARRLLNPPSDLVALCSDKLRLCEFLTERDIPTIPTACWSPQAAFDGIRGPLIVKPRFGAGSQDIRLFDSLAAAQREAPPATPGRGCVFEELVAQPYIRGTAVSVAAFCYGGDSPRLLLPVALQRLSDDGRFRYLGGRVPWTDRAADDVVRVVERTCDALPDLAGYVGFDVVVPDARDRQPLLVEINPRLTTSYLGYRALAQDNLAARLLESSHPQTPIRWKTSSVSFLADGSRNH